MCWWAPSTMTCTDTISVSWLMNLMKTLGVADGRDWPVLPEKALPVVWICMGWASPQPSSDMLVEWWKEAKTGS